jgi:hypothetical protein
VDDTGKPTYEPIFLRDDIIKAPSEKLYIHQIEEDLSSAYAPSDIEWINTTDGTQEFRISSRDLIKNTSSLRYEEKDILLFKISSTYYFAYLDQKAISGGPEI